jgi:hypothetical protein
MTDKLFKSSESLSVQELEARQELTVAIPSSGAEVAKNDNNDTTIDRCSGNKGK